MGSLGFGQINFTQETRIDPMPLVKGNKAKTKEGIGENIAIERRAGKPEGQAIAIAYSEAGKSKRKPKKK
jgi:hypothetical protein